MSRKNISEKDLPVLADLIEELGFPVHITKSGSGWGLNVHVSGGKIIRIEIGYGIFIATDYIPGIPMSPFGHGAFHNKIDI